MSFKTIFTSLPLLWTCVTALPAGPGSISNGTSIPTPDVRIAAASTVYTLIDTYNASNWATKFTVMDITDPTHGFVDYVDAADATSLGLLKTVDDQVYMGVDTTTVLDAAGTGRKSVRVQSTTAYNHALVIADFAHVPASTCGSWPAFWMVGPNWPTQGEIDIYEGVSVNTANQATLHTSTGCVPTVGTGGETGTRVDNADCGASGGYSGCGVLSSSSTSYGTGFNTAGGGVYAALWTSTAIQVWYFAEANIPANIASGVPDPTTWGTPLANFGSGCDYDSYFTDLNIIFDTTFCGDWAGSADVWGASTCASLSTTCNAYVAANPQAFVDSYWLVNSVKVYSV